MRDEWSFLFYHFEQDTCQETAFFSILIYFVEMVS